ncbi:hypothetical protein WR25_14479 [Diploscapter pachys]|uniref:Transthyretin-like family protein n=1 Tax=Diploscapter pachys TaxID=2018661 RepID=A0A2A2LCS3_9BILA|nr:hypothetical protein WR25_14479 [Diploscapter pachys]
MNSLDLLVCLGIISCAFAMRQQAIAVKGTLLCGNRPASGVEVKIFDEDDGPDLDDLLDEGFTNADGTFMLKGSESELTDIDPKFKIYHDCDDSIKPGQRKVKFEIPSQYISAGGLATKVFDIGVLNLETIFPGEERSLI